MRLARKLNLMLILGVIMVMAAFAYFETRQEVVLSDADRQRTQQVALAWLLPQVAAGRIGEGLEYALHAGTFRQFANR